MRSRVAGIWLRTSLLVIPTLLTACAPRATPVRAPLAATEAPIATATQAATGAPLPIASATLAPTVTQPPTELPPVATSRGDLLEATDPDTVTLASGGLQLVEFFAFW